MLKATNYHVQLDLTDGHLYFSEVEVSGKTIGIIGLGEIGSAVARRARAFDMDVLYTGPNRKEEKEREIGAKYVDLDTLLKNADFITINAAIILKCII